MLEYDTCLKDTSRKRRKIDISEGIDIKKQMHQKSAKFVIIGTLKILVLSMSGCHGLMQKAISFNDVAIVYVKGSAYRIYFWYMSKDDAINIMNNSNLINEMGVS